MLHGYLRIDNKDGERYIRIIRSVRKNDQVVKETVYSLGKVSDYTSEQPKRFGTKFFELGEVIHDQIRKALDYMQVSLTKNNEDHFYLRSANKENIDVIINRMGLKKLPDIIPQNEINNYT